MQLIFTPISFFINFAVVAPILGLLFPEQFGVGNMDFFALIFGMVILFVIGIAVNELFIRLKGKKTAEYYEVKYLGTDVDVTDRGSYYEIEVTPYIRDGVEKKITIWGILARILAFLAFPLRLISLLMSYVALFCPAVYSNYGELDPKMPVRFGAQVTHFLFDFVIVAVEYAGGRNRSAKGLIWTVVYIAVGVLAAAGSLIVGMLVAAEGPGFLTVPLLLVSAFSTVTTVILMIKYAIIISFDYTVRHALRLLLKMIALPFIVLAINAIVHFLPWESWGFLLR